MFRRFAFIIVLFIATPVFAADIHYVSTDGTAANWAACESDTDPGGGTENYCSLATANANAAAGDTVRLKAGTYSDPIKPSNSGSSGNEITWDEESGEAAILGCDTQESDTYYYGILLDGVDYNIIKNIEIDCGQDTKRKLVVINNGADHNELDSMTIHGGARDTGNSGVHIKDTGADDGGSTHNWIHDCTIYDAGYINDSTCQDESNLMKIGNYSEDYISHYNTIEDNILYWGGHHLLETYTMYNVIRNNVMHNEGWMDHGTCDPEDSGNTPDENDLWGNRCVQIYDGLGRSELFNLFEQNRLGHSGPPPDGNGAIGIEITAPKNIVRYNYIFNSGEKQIHLKQGTLSDGENNRIYNNTLYKTRNMRPTPDGLYCGDASDNNVIVNNIVYLSYGNDIGLKCDSADGNDLVPRSPFDSAASGYNWVTSNGDPSFASIDMSDKTSTTEPTLELNGGSGAINTATYLTVTTDACDVSEADCTTIDLDDALFFQDGTWGSELSSVAADYIVISSSASDASGGEEIQISSIDYDTNVVTLVSEPTSDWEIGYYIFLGKISDGSDVLVGALPDFGAYEASGSEPIPPVQAGFTISGGTLQ
jgi:hypothetical protein